MKYTKLIFIGGTGRSGTTILAKTLGKYPWVFTLPTEFRLITDPDGWLNLKYALVDEWSFFQGDFAMERLLKLIDKLSHKYISNYPNSSLERLVGKVFLKSWKNNIVKLFSYSYETNIWGARANLFNKGISKIIGINQFTKIFLPKAYYTRPIEENEFFKISSYLLTLLFNEILIQNDSQVLVDHTPSNSLHSRFIVKLFPEAKIINIFRDPRDVVASYKKKDWGSNEIINNIKWVKDTLSKIDKIKNELSHDKFINLRFEDFVMKKKDVLATLSDFLKFDISEIITNADFSKHNIGNWKKILNNKEKKIVSKAFEGHYSLYER